MQYVFGLIQLSLHLCRHVEISQCVDTDTRQTYLCSVSLTFSILCVCFTTFIFIHSYLRIYSLTCQMWIGFLLWRSRRGSWIVVWRHSPYWYYHWGRECPRYSRAGGGWLEGSRPGRFCRSRGRSWWTRPRASASRCCSWTCAAGNQTAGSPERAETREKI